MSDEWKPVSREQREAESKILTRAQQVALERFRHPAGARYGRYTYIRTSTARALERKGFVVLGHWREWDWTWEQRSLPWAVSVDQEQPEEFRSHEREREIFEAEIARIEGLKDRRRKAMVEWPAIETMVGKFIMVNRLTRRHRETPQYLEKIRFALEEQVKAHGLETVQDEVERVLMERIKEIRG